MFDFSDKVVVVGGASGNLGLILFENGIRYAAEC